MPTIAPQSLRTYIARIFEAAGTPALDATIVAEHLVEANLKGHDSHGVIRTPVYLDRVKAGHVRPRVAPHIERETASTAVIDGGWTFGQVVARLAMTTAIAKAQASGVGVVVARHSGHIGRVGAYVELAAAEGLIGIAMVNAPGGGQVAPFGGVGPRLSTNPMAVAIPTSDPDAPLVLDMATSMVAAGKVRLARNRGERIPPDWIVDNAGGVTEDPSDLDASPAGALLPLGGVVGHKGFGLSLMIEALGGALSGHGTSRPNEAVPIRGNGIFMLAIDSGRFGGRDAFLASIEGLLGYVTSPPYQPGFERIMLPGDPERAWFAVRSVEGIALDDTTWRQIVEAGESVGVPPIEV